MIYRLCLSASCCLALSLLLVSQSVMAASSNAEVGQNQSESAFLVTSQNLRQNSLRGFNLGKTPAGIRPDGDFSALADTGAKLVRVMLNLTQCDGCTEFILADRERQYLELVVAKGKEYDFKVVINLAPQPGGARATFWDNPQLKASIVKQWQLIASVYKNNPVVLGYDLINEPNPNKKHPFDGESLWRDFAEELIVAIRAIDSKHPIIFEPSPGALPAAFKNLKPLPYDNIVYSVHFYEPHQLTHQGLPGFEGEGAYPGSAGLRRGMWDKDRLSQSLDPVRQFANKYSVPIYVGEFSFIRSSPDDSAYRYVKDAISIFEGEGWSWTYHAFRESPAWDAEIASHVSRGIKGEQRAQVRSTNTKLSTLLRQCLQRPGVCR